MQLVNESDHLDLLIRQVQMLPRDVIARVLAGRAFNFIGRPLKIETPEDITRWHNKVHEWTTKAGILAQITAAATQYTPVFLVYHLGSDGLLTKAAFTLHKSMKYDLNLYTEKK